VTDRNISEIKRFKYWVLHLLKCPNKDVVEEYNGNRLRCTKCGRNWFNL
jgi:hypothetical protein